MHEEILFVRVVYQFNKSFNIVFVHLLIHARHLLICARVMRGVLLLLHHN